MNEDYDGESNAKFEYEDLALMKKLLSLEQTYDLAHGREEKDRLFRITAKLDILLAEPDDMEGGWNVVEGIS